MVIFPFSSAYALDSTPSADMQAKLKALQIEIASRAASIKHEIVKKIQNKAYIGTIKSRADQQITLVLLSGEKNVRFTDDTIFVPEPKSKVKFFKDSLKEGDYLAALGDLDDSGTLVAKKLIKLTPPTSDDESKKDLLWGKVISSTKSALTLELADKTLKTFSVSPQTSFFVNAQLSQSLIFEEDQIIAVVSQNPKEDNPKAILIHHYTSAKVKVASPSATPTEKPSKIPTPTKKVSPTPKKP